MTNDSSSYSAEVVMFLVLAGEKLPLGQLGPAHCILERASHFPPCEAEIVLNIDGSESRLLVFLPEGIAPDQSRVVYQSLAPSNGNGHA